jgi:hypothetical protein
MKDHTWERVASGACHFSKPAYFWARRLAAACSSFMGHGYERFSSLPDNLTSPPDRAHRAYNLIAQCEEDFSSFPLPSSNTLG